MNAPASPFAPRLSAALEGVLPGDAIARAKVAAQAADTRLDQALLNLGLVPEAMLGEVLARDFGVVSAAEPDLPAVPILAELLPARYLGAAGLLPLRATADELVLAMLDPFDDFAATAIALKTGRAVVRKSITRQLYDRAFAALYEGEMPLLDDLPEGDRGAPDAGDLEILRDAASDAPVVRFVQSALLGAIERRASDIHLRPTRHGAEMLFRIDGDLVTQSPPDGRAFPSVISRLKILANLDISERRLPQDGRIRFNIGGQPVDIRISTMPHIHGEGAVLRVLAREIAASSLADLGFSASIEAGLDQLFSAADGLILVTGPTGSGKTTTLHAALKHLLRPDLNVVTIEDPVEYRIDGAVQIQVDDKVGLTFPRVLRSLLRQDPDIILVGEIRDAETARIAVQAALTGHLVLATLHTNSAPAAIPRLVDMGVEPYLLAAVLRGVLAQRLVRHVCPDCQGGTGRSKCSACGGSGYRGRIAVGELLTLTASWTERLAANLDLDTAEREQLRAMGYRPLAEDALDRVRAGEIRAEDLRGLIDVG